MILLPHSVWLIAEKICGYVIRRIHPWYGTPMMCMRLDVSALQKKIIAGVLEQISIALFFFQTINSWPGLVNVPQDICGTKIPTGDFLNALKDLRNFVEKVVLDEKYSINEEEIRIIITYSEFESQYHFVRFGGCQPISISFQGPENMSLEVILLRVKEELHKDDDPQKVIERAFTEIF